MQQINFIIKSKIITGDVLDRDEAMIKVSIDNNQLSIIPSMICKKSSRTYKNYKRIRKEIDKVPKEYLLKTNDFTIEELQKFRCCNSFCLSKLSHDELLIQRIRIMSKTKRESEKLQPFFGIKRFHSFCILKPQGSIYSVIKYKYYSKDEDWIGEFEAVRWNPTEQPQLQKIQVQIENPNRYYSLPYIPEQEKKRLLELVESPHNYEKIFAKMKANIINRISKFLILHFC